MKPLLIAGLLATATITPAAAQQAGHYQLPEGVPQEAFAGPRSPDLAAAQIMLDRSRHSPGVIDGVMGGNTTRAIRAYQTAHNLEVTGALTPELLQRLWESRTSNLFQRYRLTEEDVSGPFVAVPASFEAMAELERLAYGSASEKIAEKFHMDEEFLKALNPGADFGSAGTEIVVVAGRTGPIETPVARIEVDKARGSVRAYAEDGTWLASYPATVGSSAFPSPDGAMTVNAVAPDAAYYFNPEGREWGPNQRLTIAAGPNNPVGGIWIDLSEDGYGIHGSPDPQLIGKTASHGCVRLTNWDARELAAAVSNGTTVEFV